MLNMNWIDPKNWNSTWAQEHRLKSIYEQCKLNFTNEIAFAIAFASWIWKLKKKILVTKYQQRPSKSVIASKEGFCASLNGESDAVSGEPFFWVFSITDLTFNSFSNIFFSLHPGISAMFSFFYLTFNNGMRWMVRFPNTEHGTPNTYRKMNGSLSSFL